MHAACIHNSIVLPMQMDCNIEEAILGLEENHGYLAVAQSDSSIQVYLVSERSYRKYK